MYDDENSYNENDGIVGPDEDEINDYPSSIRFADQVMECPNCHEQVYEDNDSCPYCGDILFRHLKHGTFAPKSKLVAKVVVVIIALSLLFIVFSLAI